MNKRLLARRIGITAATIAGVAELVTGSASPAAAETCIDGGLTYEAMPGKWLTVPDCKGPSSKPMTCTNGDVGTDGYAHPLGQPDVNIPPCHGAASLEKPRSERVAEPPPQKKTGRLVQLTRPVPKATTRQGGPRGLDYARQQDARFAQQHGRGTRVTEERGTSTTRERAVTGDGGDMAERSRQRRLRVTGGRS